MNKVTIIGNATHDPELRNTANGIPVCTFNVAVNRRGKDAETDYFRITAWRGLAENCNRFISKGKKVAVVGSVALRTYTKKDGTTGANMEVNADEVEFLSPKSDADDSGLSYTPKDEQSGFVVVSTEDDLPF